MVSALNPLYDRAKRSDHRSQRLDRLLAKPMEPEDFCSRWVTSITPDEWGYYSTCVRELSKATGISERTVQGWGPTFSKRPKYVLTILRKEDLIRQMRLLLDKFDELEE